MKDIIKKIPLMSNIHSDVLIKIAFHYRPSSGLLLVHFRFTSSSLTIHFRLASESLQVHFRLYSGSITVHIWITPVFLQCSDGTVGHFYVFDFQDADTSIDRKNETS